jgi:hypothetical protein
VPGPLARMMGGLARFSAWVTGSALPGRHVLYLDRAAVLADADP